MSSTGLAQEIQRPVQQLRPLTWLQKNLFNSWYNALLTILVLFLLYRAVPALLNWLLGANWEPILFYISWASILLPSCGAWGLV